MATIQSQRCTVADPALLYHGGAATADGDTQRLEMGRQGEVHMGTAHVERIAVPVSPCALMVRQKRARPDQRRRHFAAERACV